MRSVFLAGLIIVAAAPATGQTAAVNSARTAGQIGERYDGYIGVAAPISSIVRSQVTSINIQRRSLYTRLAASRGVTPADVGMTAGCTLIARVGVGEAYMLTDGGWRRRGPGQPAAVPDYCR